MLTRSPDADILESMRSLSAVLVLAIAASGCGNVALPPIRHGTGAATSSAQASDLDGILLGSRTDPRVAWMQDLGHPGRAELVWPVGYHARFTPQLEIRDEHDRVVGRAGYRIIGTCFPRGPGMPIHVSGNELRPPDWQPGDG